MTMAEDLLKMSRSIQNQVLVQAEEMASGLKDVADIGEGRVSAQDPDINNELIEIEGKYKGQGKVVMNDLETVKNLGHCIEKYMAAMIYRE